MLPRAPFIAFVVFFALGILCQNVFFSSFESDATVFFGASAIIFSVCIYLFIQSKRRSLNGLLVGLAFFILGAFAGLLQNQNLQSDVDALAQSKYSAYQALVRSLPEKKKKSLRFEVEITNVKLKDHWQKKSVRALVSLPLNATLIPAPGDYILGDGALQRPVKALNPDEFDYRDYLWNKGIVWTDYLMEGSYSVTKIRQSGWQPRMWSIHVSQWADEIFRQNIRNDQSYGLVKAMLLGRRDDLGPDQVNDYTISGTVHILSVSGMHVAIIFLVLQAALGWLKRLTGGKILYLTAMSLLLGFYALVTGLPPSVQRATLMCLVFIASDVFGRRQNSMNTLAISALLILTFDAKALFDVGFQLSFLAMSGIFMLLKPIEKLYEPSNAILKYTWKITAMSFAAQLATFPLSLYYFHQFPVYFWLVNPFVITFTNILLPASMLLLLTSLVSLSWLQGMINWVVETCCYLTNISVSVTRDLPGNLIKDLSLDRIEVFLLYFLIFLVWYSYQNLDYGLLKRSAFVTLVFVFYSVSASIQTYFSSNAMIHSVPKHSVISFKDGNRLYISCDSVFEADKESYDFHLKNYAVNQGITETIFLTGKSKKDLKHLQVRNLEKGRLLLYNGKMIYQGEGSTFTQMVDYSLTTSGREPDNGSVKTGKSVVLLSGEIRGRARDRWKRAFAESGVNFHDLEEGYLLLH